MEWKVEERINHFGAISQKLSELKVDVAKVNMKQQELNNTKLCPPSEQGCSIHRDDAHFCSKFDYFENFFKSIWTSIMSAKIRSRATAESKFRADRTWKAIKNEEENLGDFPFQRG